MELVEFEEPGSREQAPRPKEHKQLRGRRREKEQREKQREKKVRGRHAGEEGSASP